ncbi:MAG: SRPBCC family protein [Alphaproteobacteria bacterium]|jgi:hypothetical protein|nr:SRPBCC family protein [Alphaproteobacteria bacterium]
MSIVTVRRHVAVEPEAAWAVLADFIHIDRFHPAVDTVKHLGGPTHGLGAARRCEFYDGKGISETVTNWVDGRSYSVELSEMSMPLKRASATLAVGADSAGGSVVSMTMDFTPKFGPIGMLMGAIMMRPMMRRMFETILKGFEHHAVTGELIGKGGTPVAGSGRATDGSPATA